MDTSSLLAVLGIHLLAVMSPGPDFAVVVKNSLAHGRKQGVVTALGITVGILAHLTYSFLGLGFLIAKSILIFSIVKYCGAVYLLWIGIQALRSKQNVDDAVTQNHVEQAPVSPSQAFKEGLLTNLLNPKATLFFVGIFTQFITPETSLAWYGAVTIGIVFNQAWWFSSVALVFSLSALRGKTQGIRIWLDRTMGAVLIALGLKVALSQK